MITNSEQLLASDLVYGLGDKKKNAFGFYMCLIKRHGENKTRSVFSEVMSDFREGKDINKVKVFLYRLTKSNDNHTIKRTN